MKTLTHKLERLGLSEKESATYLTLLEAAFGLSIAIISKKTSIKRSTVYLTLESLKKRGLVSMTKNRNRHVYVAEDPRIFDQKIKEQGVYLQEILPELLSITNVLARKPQIRFFEGIEGIKEVYRDTLQQPKGSEILAWATDDFDEKFDPLWLTEKYVPSRVGAKIHSRVLAPNTSYLKDLAGDNVAALRKIRLLPPEEATFTVEVNLYNKRKVALVAPSEQFGIIIESQSVFETLKAIFENAWKNSSDSKILN
ncbi:MAG: helix-turn-helix domain-containing protein [bacterium]|nr:helix-turn-helix domain-containing protein [bacterium]